MANICNNELYAVSNYEENIITIHNYFDSYDSVDIDDYGDEIYVRFDSKWEFPEDDMEELTDCLPNQDDIFIRVLSVEYGNLYHALWVYKNKEWNEV